MGFFYIEYLLFFFLILFTGAAYNPIAGEDNLKLVEWGPIGTELFLWVFALCLLFAVMSVIVFLCHRDETIVDVPALPFFVIDFLLTFFLPLPVSVFLSLGLLVIKTPYYLTLLFFFFQFRRLASEEYFEASTR